MNFQTISLFAAPICLLAIWIESRYLKNSGLSNFSQNDFRVNIMLGIQALFIGSITSIYMLSISYSIYTYLETWRFEILGYRNLGWSIGIWMLAIVGDDFTYYWFHRGGHKIRIMWAAHVVHHSSEHFNLSTAIRLNWVRAIFKPIMWLWMSAIGFHPVMIVACVGMSTLYQFFCHTRFCSFWNKLSWILNTPGLHAVHHGVDDHCIDKNFSGVFIFFDKLFGTYAPLTSFENLHFGVTHPPSKENVWEISTHEFKSLYRDICQSKTWIDKIQYMLQAPGWKPGTKTLQYKYEISRVMNLSRKSYSLSKNIIKCHQPLKIISVLLLTVLPVFAFSQKVGIGTTTPLTMLHIKGTADASQLTIQGNTSQSNSNPLIMLRKGNGAPLIGYNFSGISKPANSEDLYGLSYVDFVVPLVKAIQELSVKNEIQQANIATLQTDNENLVQRIEALEKFILTRNDN